MAEEFSLAVVLATASFFIVLGAGALVAPVKVRRFLLGFATSRSRHFAELALRFLVGGAFVVSSSRMMFPAAFNLFGWILLATTAVLLLVPWRWHHRFASRSVPAALRFLPLIGISAAAFGGLILLAVLRGITG